MIELIKGQRHLEREEMQKFYIVIIYFGIFFLENCSNNGLKDGGEEVSTTTGRLKIIISYSEPLRITRIIKIWIIRQEDIAEDCMIPALDPKDYPVVASNELSYTIQDYENSVIPYWELDLPQDTYSIIVRGFDEDGDMVSLGCVRTLFVVGLESNEVRVSLYYNN